MIKTAIAGVLIAASMATPVHNKDSPKEEWKDIGKWRVTTFDVYCNDPPGSQSASGKPLEYGDVAMNGVPLGSKISIEGEIFTVTDRCGIDGTVDIFIENDAGYCTCNTLEYKNVRIKTKGGNQ